MRSEETTTPYPIDEEAMECGENCSFEDGEEQGPRFSFVQHGSWNRGWPMAGAAIWGSPGSEVREVLGTQGLGAVAIYSHCSSIQIVGQPCSPTSMSPPAHQLRYGLV